MISPASYEFLMGLLGNRFPQLVLVLANLFPLYPVLTGSWTVGDLLILYWAENLVIGFYALQKILLSGFRTWLTLMGNLFFAVFFCIHYGGFVGIHGVFLIQFFPMGGEGFAMDNLTWPFFLVFPEILLRVTEYMFQHMSSMLLGGFVLLFLSHGVSFTMNFLFGGEVEQTNPREQMFSPYGRIVVMHLAILLGAFLVATLGSTLPFLVILVTLKIGLDVVFHNRSHSKLAAKQAEMLQY